jgi:ATP-dependent RNA helicase SUPV3L1/SUV3
MTGERPPGAFAEGQTFTVTPAMTSLLGASGEDMAVILKGLGYRMEKRPKPPELRVEPSTPMTGTMVDATPAAFDTSEPGEPLPEVPPSEEPPVTEPTIEPPAEEPPPLPPSEAPPLEEPPTRQPPAEEPPVEEPSDYPLGDAAQAGHETANGLALPPSVSGMTPTDGAGQSPEPEMIEVWRLAPHPRREHRKPRATAPPRRHRRGSDGEKRFQQAAKPRPGGSGTREHRRSDRDGARAENPRPDRKERPPRTRERAIDPDSPFAALQALKQEMEKNRGE